ncbi:helix-turn-helix domain-containing protein [Halalkalibacter sp. APA_J-10(15)]|uniref:helix-turn-helix domain-containing protein n=1 Tax=unclassified Halalkalibacter TaxID=2893063 RepID=UPI001FF6AB6C|nr:helix-turn-helix domain-containing protein [Halalkalibacter sp. APA_J-10(15)]MCK0472158.1 helix-turn-helix domain-containing protein [Halalkalibacter sp. APA_J-10(15)]
MDRKQYIILTVLAAFNGERSIFGAYHVLQGKKSAQTIQDQSLFMISSYFGLFPKWSRDDFIFEVKKLIALNYIEKFNKDRVKLTKCGIQTYEQKKATNNFAHDLNGWKYHKWSRIVWLRLALYIQSLSFLISKEPKFYPLTQRYSVQQWVKKHLPKDSEIQKQQFVQIHNELKSILDDCETGQAKAFTYQLSSKNNIGKTKKQIAEEMTTSEDIIALLHKSVIHKICNLAQNETAYPMLHLFVNDIEGQIILTDSTKKTYELIQRGLSLNDIMNRRQLKKSTIEDHIVEMAYAGVPFQYKLFITEKAENEIIHCIEQLRTTKLRVIKEHLNDTVTYFMIRLVIAIRKVHYES